MSQSPVNPAEVCYRCAYFYDYGSSGQCRRNAPTRGEHGGKFPELGHGGWCGEFKLRPERAVDVPANTGREHG